MRIPTNMEILEKVAGFLGRYGIVLALSLIVAWWGYNKLTEPFRGRAATYQMGHWQEGDTIYYDGQTYTVESLYKYFGESRVDVILAGEKK